jgi:hypothetical protein
MSVFDKDGDPLASSPADLPLPPVIPADVLLDRLGNPWKDPFPQGECCGLTAWNAVLPDPRTPGKFRRVRFVIEMRMELLEEEIPVEELILQRKIPRPPGGTP